MDLSIDYYLSLQSPWTYLGHQRLSKLAERHSARVVLHPLNLGLVFPATGGLPLPKRAPARRFYRLVELRRWSEYLGLPLNLEPRHFPTDEKLAAAMVLAQQEQDPAAALQLAGAVLRAVWAEERDIAERDTLLTLAARLELDGAALIRAAEDPRFTEHVDQDSEAAVARGVFGVPTYVFRDELFWGQDRLDFLDRALSAAVR